MRRYDSTAPNATSKNEDMHSDIKVDKVVNLKQEQINISRFDAKKIAEEEKIE